MKKSIAATIIVVYVVFLGCSQEKGQPVQTQTQGQQQQQTTSAPPTSKEFMFRGIKMGVPVSNQFKECKITEKSGCGDDYKGACGVKYFLTADKEMCWSEYGPTDWVALFGIPNFDEDTYLKKVYYVLGKDKSRPYIIRNLTPLESINSVEYVGLIDGNIESIAMEFGKGEGLKVVEVIKAKYGPPTEANSTPIKDGVQAILKWITQEGYLIELRTSSKSDDGSGTVLVKSPLYQKKQQEFLKGQI